MAKKRETKSPIKNLPVRTPGQSIATRIEHLFNDRIMGPMVAVFMAFAVCTQAWIGELCGSFMSPIVATILLAIAVLWFVKTIRKNLPEFRNLKLGLLGERAVGQFLDEKLRPAGYQILHDIPGDGFNVDHVVIGTSGIYTIETKTHSKPAKGGCSITYDGNQIEVNGFKPDRDPVVQAKAQTRWLTEIFEQSTGRKFKIQPVVLYPGWFVESSTRWPEVWVMNEKQFPATITRQKPFIGEADVHLLTYHLKLHVIAKTKEEDAKR